MPWDEKLVNGLVVRLPKPYPGYEDAVGAWCASVNGQEVYCCWAPRRGQASDCNVEALSEAVLLAVTAMPATMARFPCGSFL